MQDVLNTFSKGDLVRICRAAGVAAPGDYARTPKQRYIDVLLAADQATVQSALGTSTPAPAPQAVTAPISILSREKAHPDVKVVRQESLGKLFGIKGKHASRKVSVWNDPDAPTLDPQYRFDAEQLFDAVTNMERGRHTWLAGPASTGKTEFVKNVCAALGRAFIRISFDGLLERYEVVGGERAVAGTQIFQKGPVLRSMTRPGAVVLLDEVGFARPEYLSSLHGILEPGARYQIPETGEVVVQAPGQVFFAADNSNGAGDSTGHYVGVRPQNYAFRSRFARVVVFDYLKPAVETAVLADRSGCDVQLAGEVVRLMGIFRTAVETSQLEIAPVLREAIAFCEACADGIDPRRAFTLTIVNRAAQEAQEVLQQLWKQNVDPARFQAAVEGKLTDAAVVEAPVEEELKAA
jgi:cobaltochelatase CobS